MFKKYLENTNLRGCQILISLGHPQRRQWHPTPVLLPGISHGWRSLVGCSPWGLEESTRLSDFTFTFHFHGEAMATHSSVLAWRIPGSGEPDGLLSMGLHRVGHNWSDLVVVVAHPWICNINKIICFLVSIRQPIANVNLINKRWNVFCMTFLKNLQCNITDEKFNFHNCNLAKRIFNLTTVNSY